MNKTFPLDFRDPLEDHLNSDESSGEFVNGSYSIARVWAFVRGVAANGAVVEAQLPAGRLDFHGRHMVVGGNVVLAAFCITVEKRGNHLQVTPRSLHLASFAP